MYVQNSQNFLTDQQIHGTTPEKGNNRIPHHCNHRTVTFIARGKLMKCPKCKGRMYSEKLYDFVRSFEAWKCCSCGEVLDPTILANRVRNQNLFLG